MCHYEVVAKETTRSRLYIPVRFRVQHTRQRQTRRTLGRHVRGQDWCDYFDPYGQKPQHAEFTNFVNEHCSQWSPNDHILQSPIATVSGQYCAAFLMFRCRNISMHPFARLFTSDVIANDCRMARCT